MFLILFVLNLNAPKNHNKKFRLSLPGVRRRRGDRQDDPAAGERRRAGGKDPEVLQERRLHVPQELRDGNRRSGADHTWA